MQPSIITSIIPLISTAISSPVAPGTGPTGSIPVGTRSAPSLDRLYSLIPAAPTVKNRNRVDFRERRTRANLTSAPSAACRSSAWNATVCRKCRRCCSVSLLQGGSRNIKSWRTGSELSRTAERKAHGQGVVRVRGQHTGMNE